MNRAVGEFYWSMLPAAGRLLDLGCGDGSIGRWRPEGSVVVVGMDSDPKCIAVASQHEEALLWDLDDGRPLPFEDASFDAVVAKDILEHLQRPWLLVREIRRVLRPGGRVLASVICDNPRKVWSDYTHVRGFTQSTARLLFEHQGLTVARIWRMGPVPLASRASMLWVVPFVLTLPGFRHLWFSSFELMAFRPAVVSQSAR